MATPAGLENKVAFIWKIADKLRGHLKPHEYGTVMLPTLVLFRLDAVLEPTKAADPNRVYPFLAQVSPVLARKHNARRRGRLLLARFADRAACLLGDRAEDAPCRWSDVSRNSSAEECCNAARTIGTWSGRIPHQVDDKRPVVGGTRGYDGRLLRGQFGRDEDVVEPPEREPAGEARAAAASCVLPRVHESAA